ncbi:MAG: BamA/TamA family outer membrane protein [Salinibacter sp.]
MPRFLLACLGLVVGLLGGPAHGQSAPGSDTTAAADPTADWLLLPFASYAPDTKLAGGVVVGYYRPEPAEGRASSVQATITVTQRRQLIAQITPELYLADGRWRVQGELQASHFPNSFYGIGGGTPAAAEEAYTSRYVVLDGTAQRRVGPTLRVGPRVLVRADAVRDPDAGGLIDRGRVPGARGGRAVGIGASAFWDARDNRYYPRTGAYAEIVATLYSAAWGSEYTFAQFKVDLRGYRSLGPGVWAGQIYAESVAGTAPFQLLPLLGGDERMRGYREGRYRDDVYWTAQAEYRFPLVWRLKGAAFASVGEVGPRLGAELAEDVEAAVGLGGRFRFTDDGVHGRLDLAYSPTGLELYISLGEAF